LIGQGFYLGVRFDFFMLKNSLGPDKADSAVFPE
jgi:hypothetical protein